MSKGPGIIQRAIETAFTGNADGCFSTAELASIAFPGLWCVEKKHRVSVIRAAEAAGQRLGWNWIGAEAPGNPHLYFNMRSVRSYTLARGRARFPEVDPVDLAERIAGTQRDWPGIEWTREQSKPGGAWDLHVRLWSAELDGQAGEAAAIREEIAKIGT